MLASRGLHLPSSTTLHGTDITLVGLDRSYLPSQNSASSSPTESPPSSPYLRTRTREAFQIDSEDRGHPQLRQLRRLRPNPELVAGMRPRFAEPKSASSSTSPLPPRQAHSDVVQSSPASPKAMPARLMLIGEGPTAGVAEYLARDTQRAGPHPLHRQADKRSTELLPWPT